MYVLFDAHLQGQSDDHNRFAISLFFAEITKKNLLKESCLTAKSPKWLKLKAEPEKVFGLEMNNGFAALRPGNQKS